MTMMGNLPRANHLKVLRLVFPRIIIMVLVIVKETTTRGFDSEAEIPLRWTGRGAGGALAEGLEGTRSEEARILEQAPLPKEGLTVVMPSHSSGRERPAGSILATLIHYAACPMTSKLVILWSDPIATDETCRYLHDVFVTAVKDALGNSSRGNPDIAVHVDRLDRQNFRFNLTGIKTTAAVFSIDDDFVLPCNEVRFMFEVWKRRPYTMVGAEARFVKRATNSSPTSWKYRSYARARPYNVVLTEAAIMHRGWMDHYTSRMDARVREYVESRQSCEDFAMSFLVSYITDAPPILVACRSYHRKSHFRKVSTRLSKDRHIYDDTHNTCIDDLVNLYGGVMPLRPTIKVYRPKERVLTHIARSISWLVSIVKNLDLCVWPCHPLPTSAYKLYNN